MNGALKMYVDLYNSKFSINWEKMSKSNYKQQSRQPFFVSANQRPVFYFAFKISTNPWNDCFNAYLASVWAAYQVTIKNVPPDRIIFEKNLGCPLGWSTKFFFPKKIIATFLVELFTLIILVYFLMGLKWIQREKIPKYGHQL